MQNMAEKICLETLKRQYVLTPMECDIVETQSILYSWPFDIDAAKQKQVENFIKYPEIFPAFFLRPAIAQRPIPGYTEADVKHNLRYQLNLLCQAKSVGAIIGRWA